MTIRGLCDLFYERYMYIRKDFFTLRVIEHWHRLTREVLECPSLKILKTMSGHNSMQPDLSEPALAEELD